MEVTKPSPPTRPRRKHYLDNLRNFGTAHVILHHTAASYGYGGGPNGPHSACFDKASPLVTACLAVDLAWGLGQFFWISGYFSAESLTKSSDAKFIKNKLMRLGAPALLYSIFLHPLQAVFELPKWDWASVKKAYVDAFLKFKGAVGSAWHSATILSLDLLVVLLKRFVYVMGLRQMLSAKSPRLGQLYVQLCRWGWTAVAAGSFLIRTKFPPGRKMPLIDVEPSFVLQYAYAYAMGHLAYHAKKPRLMSLVEGGLPDYTPKNTSPKLSLLKASAFAAATLPVLFVPGMVEKYLSRKKTAPADSDKKQPSSPEGSGMNNEKADQTPDITSETNLLAGWTTTAALSAIWAEVLFNTISPAHINYMERNHSTPTKMKLWSPRYAYGAFLLHSPVSWVIGETVDSVLCPDGKKPDWMESKVWQNYGPLIMSGVVGTADVVASYATSMFLIDYVPGVGRFL
ncbi:hypothetical protein PG997_013429 [Apiospora hydei]|uniref:Acyltransferase 3 domain-containing protein n=1 Tax=Apiospora hydei TaxID=1337664 RepID=A0ABR1V6X8_9PEZI